MEGQSRLTVNIGDIDDQIRPRSNSESSAKKPELAKKKSEQFQLPQIFVEEVDDFDDFEPISRQRAYTSPEEMFQQRRSRPGTPPPRDEVSKMSRKHVSLEKIGAQPHKLCQVPEI